MQALGLLEKQYNKIEKLRTRKTNTKMNALKAFAIFAVVSLHCSGGSVSYFMDRWVHPAFYYLTIFIFISGYFYKPENDSKQL